MSSQNLIIELKDSTQIITLNRPNALNAFNKQVRAELEQAIDDAEANKNVKAVVLTGNGRAFGAGKDLPEFIGNGGTEWLLTPERIIGSLVKSET